MNNRMLQRFHVHNTYYLYTFLPSFLLPCSLFNKFWFGKKKEVNLQKVAKSGGVEGQIYPEANISKLFIYIFLLFVVSDSIE